MVYILLERLSLVYLSSSALSYRSQYALDKTNWPLGVSEG